MPRKSASSRELEHFTKGVEIARRPSPPEELSAEAASEWIMIVNSLRADWFSDYNLPLLAQYCRHIVQARKFDLLMQRELRKKRQDVAALSRLAALIKGETQSIATLATRMRLSQHATTTHGKEPSKKKAGGGVAALKPWEVGAIEADYSKSEH